MSEDTNAITPESLGYIGGFMPTVEVVPLDTKDEVVDTAGEVKKDEKPVDKLEVKKDDKGQSLAELLRADREARQSRTKEANETKTVKDELTKVRAELDQLRNGTSFEDDPIGYCKARKLSPEAQIALGEALIYDLAPSKAPADLRQRLFEDKHKRETSAREAKLAEDNAKRDMETVRQNIETFALGLEHAAKSFTTGSFPESEVWFEDNHETYLKSLMATADNLARIATQNRQVADLSPSNIAKTLETEIAKRMANRDAKRRPSTTKTEQAVTKTETNNVDTTSAKGLNSGAHDNAYDDAERIRRASRVIFGN